MKFNIVKKLFVFIIVGGLLSACAPAAKKAIAPNGPMAPIELDQGTPDLAAFKTVTTLSIFLWPTEEELPFIRQAAIKGWERSDKQDKELLAIAQFKSLGDVKRHVGKHATLLDAIFSGPILQDYYENIKKISERTTFLNKENEELQQKLKEQEKANQAACDQKRAEIVKTEFSCYTKNANKKPCSKSIPAGQNESDYTKIEPTSCDEITWNTTFKRRCEEMTSTEKIYELLGLVIDKTTKEQIDLNSNELADLTAERTKLDEEKGILLQASTEHEIKMITKAVDPYIDSGARAGEGKSVNFFATDTASSKLRIDFSHPEKSEIDFKIKQNIFFSKDAEADKDYSSFSNSGPSELKTLQDLTIIKKQGVNKVQFKLFGHRDIKEEVDNFSKTVAQEVFPAYFDVDLKIYPFENYVILSGKIKYHGENGEIRDGMMKIVLIRD